jgi:hypothetical protein
VRRLIPLVWLALLVLAFAESAVAADCRFCLDSVALQTRDGQSWSAGKPVTLVVHVAVDGATALPSSAQAVVMQTDGDRTKCLGVPLKLVVSDASGGLYAGLFFPFRPARYDGMFVVGGDVQEITFDVTKMVAGAAPAGELPAAEPLDTSAAVPSVKFLAQLPVVRTGAIAVLSLVTLLVLYGRQRRLHRPT